MQSIEQKILACATELNLESYQSERMHQLISHEMDIDHLIDTAIKEGLASLLYRNLKKAELLEAFSQQQRERLQSFYYQTVHFNLKLIHALKEVLHLLNQESIRVILLQGMDLLQQVYDDIGLRPMMDIDLWVLEKDYPNFINILSSQGYQRDPVYPNTFRKGSTIFDLHTHILWADRIEARKFLLNKSEEHIYQHTRLIDFEGQEALCLSPYDQVLYLSLHLLKHYMNRLIWLVDIKILLADWGQSDWEALMNRAKELGQEKTLSYIFFLLFHLFDFHLPLQARQLLERKRLHVLEKKVLRERIKGDSLPFWAPILLFSSEKALKKRFSFIFESVFPRREILRQIFVDSPGLKIWQLYLMRVLQVIKKIKGPSRSG